MEIMSDGSQSVDTSTDMEPQNEGSAPSSPSEAPTPLDLADDTLIRVKGSDKPVKFADHVKGFQAQFTRASQRAAQLERQLQQERAERERLAQQARQAPTQAQPEGDVFASLRALPYLSGEDAVAVVQSIGEQIRQRDMVLLGALKKMQEMQHLVNSLSSNHASQLFDAKIAKFLQDGGYGPELTDFAKELYLAYEGDDLDEEFPHILASRIEQLEKWQEAKRAAKLEGARKRPFVPGKGGTTSPSKPLQIKPNASPKEIADELWATFGPSET